MNLDYICNHILRILHTQIRQYKVTDGYELIQYYGDTPVMDAVREDSFFAEILFSLRKEEHPVIYMEVYPVYYSIIYHDIFCFIIGPVNVEKQKTFHEGMSVDAWLAKKHGIKEMRIPYCDYEVFCQETLLLFHTLTGKELTYQQLHEKNYITDELRASLKHRESRVFFHYHEHTKIHNPYGRERREMESIRKGDVDRLQKVLMRHLPVNMRSYRRTLCRLPKIWRLSGSPFLPGQQLKAASRMRNLSLSMTAIFWKSMSHGM